MSVNSERMMRSSKHTESELDKGISQVCPPLRRYCEFLSESQHDAEDLVQTTLLKALPVLQGTKHHPNLPALLRRIAKNTWVDEVRKQGHHHLCEPEELQSVAIVGIEDNFALKDALQVLRQSLTLQQQAVILLCDVFQYTAREAAELLGVSRGAIKAMLYRARLRLESVRDGVEVSFVMDESQKETLEAYVSAFQSADIRLLVQLCQDGVLDPVQATSKAIPFAYKQVGQTKANLSGRTSMCMAA